MGNMATPSAAVAIIAAMITPALLIVGAASLVALALAIAGTLLLLGGAWMVAESHLGGEQIAEEIREALQRLEEGRR